MSYFSPAWYNAYASGPRALGDSFDLLAQGHGLHVLELRFVNKEGAAYNEFFGAGLPIVEKMKRIKNIKQLVLTGSHSRRDFRIDGKSPETYIALLKRDMLVGKKVEVFPAPHVGDESIGKTITERLTGLEKTLGELVSRRQDPAVKLEAAETMMQRIWSLQRTSLTKRQVADIIEEKLLVLQERMGDIVKAELRSIKEGLTAQTQAEKAFRDFTRDSIAGLASKVQVGEITQVLEALRKKVDALSSKI